MLNKLCCLDTDQCRCAFLGISRNKCVKLGYILLLLLGSIGVLIINMLMHPASVQIINNYGCSSNMTVADNCVEDKNGLILFSAMGVMHLVLMCCMFMRSEKVKVINQGIWIGKVALFITVSIIFRLIVATTFFTYIGYFSVWAANVLYLFQAIVFIDLVFAIDVSMEEWARQNQKIYILKAILAITIFIGASFLCFLSFKSNPEWVCWTNAGCLALFLILALLRSFPGNSILVASSVGLCLNILGFYLEQEPSEMNSYNTFLTAFKFAFLIFLLFGMLCQGSNSLRTRKSTLNQLLALNTTASEEDNRYVSSNKWTVYHYVMMMIIISIPAIYCWEGDAGDQEVRHWLQINKVVWWGGVLFFYLWSLVSSKIFPQQDFSDLENYFRQYELK